MAQAFIYWRIPESSFAASHEWRLWDSFHKPEVAQKVFAGLKNSAQVEFKIVDTSAGIPVPEKKSFFTEPLIIQPNENIKNEYPDHNSGSKKALRQSSGKGSKLSMLQSTGEDLFTQVK